MLRLKEYFTDGLLQVAIVLSLLRTDFDLYFGSQFQEQWRRSELQEIIVGPHVGYTQTDFHTRTGWRDSRVYPKHIDYLGSDDILYDLHCLADYRRFDALETGINTWLVNGPEPQLPLASRGSTSPASELGHSGPPGVSSSPQPQAQSTPVGDTNSRSFSAYFGTELTKEDMDLIDILWRQDIDLGISRDTFDASLRQEQEKEYNSKVNATEEVKTDNDTLRDSIPSDENRTNYAIDNETGELIPLTPTVTVTDDDVMQLLQQIEQMDNFYQPNDAVELKTETNENNTLDSLFDEYTFQSSEVSDGNLLSNELEASGPELSITGQLEESWQDVLSLLSDQLNMTTQAAASSVPSVIHQQQHLHNDLLTELDLLNISQSSNSSDNMTRNSVLFNHDSVRHRLLEQQQLQPQQFSDSEMWNPLNFDPSANQSLLVNNVSLADNRIFSNEPMRHLNNSIASFNRFSTPQLTLQMQPLMNDTFDVNTTFISSSPQQQLSPIFNLSQSSTPTTNITSLLLDLTDTANSSLFNGNTAVNLLNTAANNTLADLSTLNMSRPMTLSPYANNDTFIQQLLQNDLSDLTFDGNFDEDTTALDYEGLNENWSTDSAVSSMHSPSEVYAASSYNDDVTSMDGMEELEGATGGSSNSKDEIKYADMLTSYSYEYNSQKSPSFTSNSSCSFNSTQPQYPDVVPLKKHIAHNHTYYLQPGQRSREEKEAEARREKEERATRCKDAKRAQMLKIPLNIDDIIDLPVDQFTELLSRYTLSEPQHQLIRDIRRRGKNKAAAQNCRKRKLEVIQSLEDEVEGLRQERDKLRHNQMKLADDTMIMKEKFARLQADMLRSLRDASGQQYNPDEYTLQRTCDGDIILVPRNATVLGNNGNSANRSAASNVRTENNHDESDSRKRKPKKKE